MLMSITLILKGKGQRNSFVIRGTEVDIFLKMHTFYKFRLGQHYYLGMFSVYHDITFHNLSSRHIYRQQRALEHASVYSH